jgi:signal transduction histidine kinase
VGGVGQDADKPEGEALLVEAARASSNGSTLEEVTRPFLALLHSITGLDSTYLTEVKWEEDEQQIKFSLNNGEIEIPEGLTVQWSDTLCRRALTTGPRYTADVPTTFPGSEAAKALALKTYVSVPVRDENEDVVGTLCGASGEAVNISDDVLSVMEMFAQLISDQWKRDREHALAQERANFAESQLRQRVMFLAEAEHKLKTPLTILKGWSSMLADGWESFGEQDRIMALQTMKKAADQATQQVNELLDESRNNMLAMELELTPTDLSDLTFSVAKEMQGVTNKHEVRCMNVEPAVVAVADQRAVWQIFWHLGENAIKYSPDGGVVELTLHCDGADAVFCLSDEGLGVPDDIDVFEPFTRSGKDEFSAIAGTGLGLHIVRNLALAMKGSVAAERRPDRGSVFTVRLPMA